MLTRWFPSAFCIIIITPILSCGNLFRSKHQEPGFNDQHNEHTQTPEQFWDASNRIIYTCCLKKILVLTLNIKLCPTWYSLLKHPGSPNGFLDHLFIRDKRVHDVCAKPILLPFERTQMDYSAADIEAAQSLQLLAYLYAALAAFWTYDYACSFEQEWIFLFQSRWSKVKGLYIVTRHVPFFLVITDLVYLGFTSNESPDKCRILSDTYSCFGVISLTCSECISPSPAIYTCF
ncbi:hypothetical protein DEU56DRAFT_353740 [Suillus clintonianus]|uniref:uncharacterized protein n=1 Tax=Suillus clintonianus TaxID=1904413 RepID=UPI001B866EE3|nr:uncharacterized protein DEU56DRAFT_353740 [Suillus clintonianus]KAG2137028.1 hypothetical protein DEU56DRAFT_353740 [Suillus clintonianus]